MQRLINADLSLARVGEVRSLCDEEAHHLRDVLRARPGEPVELFDGAGWCCRGEVQAVDRRGVAVRLTETPQQDPVPHYELWLAVAPPKLDRLRWLVEKATELGVARLIPLLTQRTVVHPGEGKRSKLESTVRQACKQCGRNRYLEVAEPTTWGDFCRDLGHVSESAALYVADQHGQRLPQCASSGGPQRTIVIVGPEGGLTPSEADAAVALGARPLSLGKHTLRIETAAVAAAALFAGD